MLANGIDLPIVMALGLAIFGPLTMGVSLIEAVVFRLGLGASIRKTFWHILTANVASTLAGAVVFSFQDALLDAASIRSSIPSFVAGYGWFALVLIAIYYAKSVLVEGLVVATRGLATRLGHSRARIFKTVALANVASYLAVGPLFYYATRPTFGHLDLRGETTWTANPDVPVYFIDPKDHFIKRISMNGRGLTTVVPYPATEFLVTGDGGAFVYRGTDKNLYALRPGDAKPVRAWSTTQSFLMQSVSLSPDHRRLAYAIESETHPPLDYSLGIVDLDSGKTDVVTGIPTESFCPIVAWSGDGKQVFATTDNEAVAVLMGAPPWSRLANRPRSLVSDSELVDAYARHGDRCGRSGGEAYLELNSDRKGGHKVLCYPYLVAHVRVTRDDQPLMTISNDYGLLKFGFPSPNCPTFLPHGTEAILEWWDQLYLLDIEHRRMGLLTGGGNYVLLTPRFRVGFATEAAK